MTELEREMTWSLGGSRGLRGFHSLFQESEPEAAIVTVGCRKKYLSKETLVIRYQEG